jgi:hypothetical protein
MFTAMLKIITKITAEDSGGVISSCSTNGTVSHPRKKILDFCCRILASRLRDFDV